MSYSTVIKSNKLVTERWENELSEWLSDRVRFNDVPRMKDILTHVKATGMNLKKKDVRYVMLRHPYLKMNLRQQRAAGRSRMYRPIIVSNLGHWHADIGYFAANKRYATPVSYRAGTWWQKTYWLDRLCYSIDQNKISRKMIAAFRVLVAMHRKEFQMLTLEYSF